MSTHTFVLSGRLLELFEVAYDRKRLTGLTTTIVGCSTSPRIVSGHLTLPVPSLVDGQLMQRYS